MPGGLLYVLLALGPVWLGGCRGDAPDRPRPQRLEPTPPVEVTPEAEAAARSSNAFAFGLYRDLAKGTDGNLFLSPAGVSTALAMAYAGAGGGTKAGIADVLHLDGPDDAVHAGFGTLARVLDSGERGHRLRYGSRLYGAAGSAFRPEAVALLRDRYGAEPASLDFSHRNEVAAEVNRFVTERTAGKVSDLVRPEALSADTRLLLVNAVHFAGRWDAEFDESNTEEAPFRLAGGGEVEAPLMTLTSGFRYAEGDGVQALSLPYTGLAVAMVVLLPEEVGLDRLEGTLTAETVAGLLEGMSEREVEVHLPRFATESTFSLGGTLAGLGMPAAFDPARADFSGLSASPGLFLSGAVHRAIISVDEQGTEAAAATAIQYDFAAEEAEGKAVFRADRPFVYLIRHAESGAVLFLGRLVDPAG